MFKGMAFFNSNKKIIVALVVVVILLFALKKFYNNLKRGKEGLATDINEGNLNSRINYANEALRIKQTYLDPWWAMTGTIEDTAKIMLTFNNDELKEISNIFRSQYNKTMTSVVKSRSGLCINCPFHSAFVEKLERLNLA